MIKKALKGMSLALVLFSSMAQAMTLDWTGGYRFEWTQVDKPTLSDPSGRKDYVLNYLYLSPKIVATDGIQIVSRFDITGTGFAAYDSSQLGMLWGLNGNPEVAYSENQGTTDIKISQLYLSFVQEYGALLAGRAPFQFGLGMFHNAGRGTFDHWYDTRDTVAYKFIVGDWFLMPMIGRVQSTNFSQGGSISTLGFQLQYDNEESRTSLGFMQETRKGNVGTNDLNPADFNATAVSGGVDVQTSSFMFSRGFDAFEFKIEAGFQTGKTGLVNATSSVDISSYGIATEFYFPRPESKWNYSMKLGMASGDDPTTNTWEGFAFDRNYDVAMLMFNHRLGQRDFFNTDPVKSSAGGLDVTNSADDETVGNTIYVAPRATYVWSERLDVRNTLVWAQLLKTQKNAVDSGKDLGLEWDIDLVYKPNERVQWINQIGLLFPGSAWQNGADNLSNDFTFGFASKAAISF